MQIAFCAPFESIVTNLSLRVFSITLLVSFESSLSAYSIKFGQREVTVVFSSDDELALVNAVESLGKQAGHFNIYKENGLYKISVDMRVSKRETALQLMKRLKNIPGVELDSME